MRFYTSSRNILLVCKPLKMKLICVQCQEIILHINVSLFIIIQGEWVIENKILFFVTTLPSEIVYKFYEE